METVIIRERYKVVQVLRAEQGYAFAEAVDIMERETPVRLLNVYEGEQLPVYARIFTEKMDCAAFCGAFLSGDSLVAVFKPCKGIAINNVFYRGAEWGWKDRLCYAEQIFHTALGMADFPPEVSCAAMLSDNVMIDTEMRKISSLFRVIPMKGMNARELALLASDQALKILCKRFRQGDAEYIFCKRLERGEFLSIVPLYAAWRRAEEEIRTEYEGLDEKNTLSRWLAFLVKNTKRFFKRKRR